MPAISSRFVALAAFVTCAAAQKNTIVQMFGWNWDSIAQECTQHLGPYGYGYIQISPPQETVQGDAWWTDYQPVSYILQGKRGNREALAAMIDTCHSAGVKVLADAVINHMTGSEGGTGTAGTSYTHYTYGDLYSDASGSFHHCGLAANDDIVDYSSREQVQLCQLSSLADLATETAPVQSNIAAYLDDLRSLGVDGFRLDASKHMAAGDIGAILNKMTSKPEYITQEVIYGGSSEPILPDEYTTNGGVQEFRFTYTLKTAFLESGIASLPQQVPGDGWLASDSANVFVANHDTERHGPTSLTYKDGANTYTLAHVFMLAYPYGVPTVLSAYEFDNFDAGPPNAATGSCYAQGGTEGWLCQHRWAAIEGMNAFRVAVSGDVGNVQTGSQQQLAFSRGTLGFVAINNDDAAWSQSFNTGLPAGTYCNVYAGARNSTGCAGGTVEVDGSGLASLTINPREAIAFNVGAEAGAISQPAPPTDTSVPSPPAETSAPAPPVEVPAPTASSSQLPPPAETVATTSKGEVTFSVLRNTTWGDEVYVTGSVDALGNWDINKAIKLNTDAASYPAWSVTVSLSEGTSYMYKYLLKTATGTIKWEADPNRSAGDGTPVGTEQWH